MGMLIDGAWQDRGYGTHEHGGRFVRDESAFRAEISSAPGAAFPAQVDRLFEALDHLERRLSEQRYLVGDRITEDDWRLFTTLVRFDTVQVGHFKCNIRRLVDYPALWAYARELYQVPGVAETVNLDHIKRHYYTSHRDINPNAIIPAGPDIKFDLPHGRG